MHKKTFEFFFVGHQVGLEKSVRMKHGSQKSLVGFESYFEILENMTLT